MNLLINSPFEKITEAIASFREKKGEEKKTLAWIDHAIRFGKGFMANLYFERILVYQHMVIEGDKKALPKMEAATLVAQKYVEDNGLREWRSRVYRFLGRLYDYKGKYEKSIPAYKKSLSLARLDPEYVEKGVPRWLEIEGFMAHALINSGNLNKGLTAARRIYKKYDLNPEARFLRRKDYYTWAVWKSGIPIRTINSLMDKKALLDRKKMLDWLDEAENLLVKPKGARIWGDFGIRRGEIEAIKKRLQELN